MAQLKYLAAITLIGSIGWAVADPGFESAMAVITSISALISAFVLEKRKKMGTQHQTVSKSSNAIQAGGDVTIGNFRNDKNVK